jgi:DNA-binding response OmpR family regulator
MNAAAELTNPQEGEPTRDAIAVKVLVVDDDDRICRFLARALRREGYVTIEAHDGNEGWKVICEDAIRIVITDIFMPDKDGLEFICQIVDSFPDTKIIAMSAGGKVAHRDYLPDALRLGAHRIFHKPLALQDFIGAVNQLAGRDIDTP